MTGIVDGRALVEPLELETEYAVIGSGAAGAVAAQIIAATGRGVVIVEAGPFVPPANFNQREDEMIGLLWAEGGVQETDGGLIGVAQGRCVGGSTVINGGDVTPTQPPVFEHWRAHHDLPGWDPAEWSAAEARILRALDVTEIPEPLHNGGARMLRAGAAALGWKAGPFLSNRVGCIGAGYCVLGCTYDAKRSTLVTYIPQALADGARLVHSAPVDRIDRGEGGDGFVVSARGAQPIRVLARQVICAAGSIQTPLLLARSGLGGASGQLGRNLSLQPQVPVAARFEQEIVGHRGVPQSFFVDEFETAGVDSGLAGFRLESASSGPAVTASMLTGLGEEHRRLLEAYRRIAGCMVLVPDAPTGHVAESGGGKAIIHYELGSEQVATLRRGVLAAAQLWFSAGAIEVILPWERPIRAAKGSDIEAQVADLDFAPGRVRLFSAHPQGTCRVARSAERGVCSQWGQHHDVAGLYVLDASIFPTSASSHTMTPTMTAADMLTRRLLGDRR